MCHLRPVSCAARFLSLSIPYLCQSQHSLGYKFSSVLYSTISPKLSSFPPSIIFTPSSHISSISTSSLATRTSTFRYSTAMTSNVKKMAISQGRATIITNKLEQPDLDNRSYRVIRLPNKLEALIVHDPDTDKASAALDVHVGNFSDSDDLPVSCLMPLCFLSPHIPPRIRPCTVPFWIYYCLAALLVGRLLEMPASIQQ